MVISPLNHISLPCIAATLLIIHLIVVMQLSRYSIFHNGDTLIQLSLPWWSYTPFSVLTLKPPLGAIGIISLKSQASPIVEAHI